METTFQKISRKTGRKQTFCKCEKCKSQCTHQCCLGTPEDIQALINAGYADRLADTGWAAGVAMGVTKEIVDMVQPLYDKTKKACTFYNNGLCELHDKGLKPTEGKLSHHSLKADNWTPSKSLAWMIAKEWIANPELYSKIKSQL